MSNEEIIGKSSREPGKKLPYEKPCIASEKKIEVLAGVCGTEGDQKTGFGELWQGAECWDDFHS